MALVAVIIAIFQVAAFSPSAEAASPVAKISSCDTAITTMNKTLILIAKKRVAVRTAKGAKKVKKAKKSLKSAQKQGNQVRSKIKQYCLGSGGVNAQDAQCSLSINSYSKSLQLAYTRKLQIKKIKGHGKKANKRKKVMRTQLKKLNAKAAADMAAFQHACGNGGGNGGGGNNQPADNTPPGSVTMTGPSSPTNDPTPTYEITPPSGESGGHIECKIDNGAYVTVSSPYTTPELSDGTHTITCRYVDEAGNAGPGTTVTVTVDTTKPGTVTIDGPSGATNDTTPTFTLSGAEPGDRYECKVDDGDFATVTSPFTTDSLAEGAHSVTCHLVDAAGNVGDDTTKTFEVDTTNTDGVDITGPGGPTNDNTPEIDVTTPNGPGHLECKLNDGAWVTVTSPFTLDQLNNGQPLADGTYTVTCHWVDGAGNPGPDTTFTVVIDTTAPGGITVNGPTGATNDNTPSYAINGGGEPVEYQCKIDGGAYVTVPAAYTTSTLSDGTHTITCRAVDGAGNTGPGTSVTVTVDTVAPGAVTMTGPSGATNDNTPTYILTGGEAGATYQCKVDGGSYANVTTPYTTAALSDGSHTISCRAVDAAGNTGPATSKTVSVDTVAPGGITISGPSGLTNNGSPSYTLAGATGGDGYQCKLDGGSYAAATSPYKPTLTEGAHTITCRAIDAAGNTGPASAVNVTLDTVGPATTIADGTIKWDGTHNFNLTANEAGASYKCSIDGGAYNAVPASYTTGVLSNGAHVISCKATDAAGNTGAVTTQGFGVFKDPVVVSKSGGFQWGLGCTMSNFLNALLGCPDSDLVIAMPANPNGLTGSYLVDVGGYVKDLSAALGFGAKYTMYITVDGASVASDSETVPFDICGIFSADLSASKTN
ncbi:MAG: Ig-like domain-containing protein, partial [Solirubrobacterales bacterium]